MHALRNMVLLAALLASSTFAPAGASACGGCFHPPPPPMGTPTPVTAHRIAVAISPSGTTLWDQIEYAGSPSDFVWVLPVASSARVELAEDAFFLALTDATQITMVAPDPPLTSCPDPCRSVDIDLSIGDLSAGADAGMPSPVDIFYEGVVGPYETVTIGSEDPDALLSWLQERGYMVSDTILPTIRHYTDLGLAFAVLRLRPSAGVQQMRPVRVTSPGLSTVFPLRMVAAGVQGSVELELFVFAEGRMEADNFGNAEVDRDAITYDWATNRFNYDELFEEARFVGTTGSTNWVTEFAGLVPRSVASFRVLADDGSITTSADDWAVVTAALERPFLTRMRAELRLVELDRDLNLRLSSGADLTRNRITVERELNRSPDLECPTFCSGASGDRDLRGVGPCEVRTEQGSPGGLLLLFGGLLAAFLLRRRG